jgi:hypothetical protein
MTAADLGSTTGVRAVLFGSHDDAVHALLRSLNADAVGVVLRHALADHTQDTKSVALGQLARVVTGLLEFDLTDILAAAWRRRCALLDAAHRTANAPGGVELVGVTDHRITLAHQPYVELFVDGVAVTTVDLELWLELEVKSLVAGVRSGRLTAIHRGTCAVRARLAIEGAEVVQRIAHLALPLVIQVGNGISLLHGPKMPQPPASARSST